MAQTKDLKKAAKKLEKQAATTAGKAQDAASTAVAKAGDAVSKAGSAVADKAGRDGGAGPSSRTPTTRAGTHPTEAADSSKVWGVFSLVSALGAAAVAKKAINGSWKATTGKTPPENPADPDVELREALLWAAVSGTFVAVARMLAQRRAAHYYVRSTGKLPPGLGKDK